MNSLFYQLTLIRPQQLRSPPTNSSMPQRGSRNCDAEKLNTLYEYTELPHHLEVATHRPLIGKQLEAGNSWTKLDYGKQPVVYTTRHRSPPKRQ